MMIECGFFHLQDVAVQIDVIHVTDGAIRPEKDVNFKKNFPELYQHVRFSAN
jgi:hypothetical protein